MVIGVGTIFLLEEQKVTKNNQDNQIQSVTLGNRQYVFLQRVSIACYAERCISYDRFCLTDRTSDRVTVCHTLVSCKTTPATIMRSSLEDSPMTLVSSWLTSPKNSKGNIGSEGAE